jgi:exodeoxyribonuclease-3
VLPRASWDREGRLVVVVLPSLRLGVANVYAVNGTNKPHFDHEAGRHVGDRHAWKRRFHEHLADVVRAADEGGLDTLLIGDFNVSQTRADTTPRLRTEEPHAGSRAHFTKTLLADLGMVDVFRALHPDARAYTWFSRRSRPSRLDAARVDFALLPERRLGDVTKAWIDEGEAGHHGSDHAPVHVVIRRRR